MEATATLSPPFQFQRTATSLFNQEETRLFILLRYVLIIAAAYLFLFEGNTALPIVSVLLITAALASNVFLSSLLQKIPIRSAAVGLIVCGDIGWLVIGLWYKGAFEADIYVLYFFILLLAAMGQRLSMVVGAGLLLSAVDMTFLAMTRDAHLIWTSSSLIRVPFIFVVSVFYGYIADKVRREQQNTLMEKELAERLARAIHAQLFDLRQQAEDLQKSYDQMKRQAIELEKSNKAKDDFFNVVSHELRTPLSLISGYAEMIRARMIGEVNSEQEAALYKIKRHSGELLVIVDSILDATKVDAGACQLESYEFNLVDFLDGMRSNYDIPLGKEVALIWDYGHDLPIVTTDSVKLKHILENLINNAIKFTETGTIVISARQLPDRGFVELKVRDTGIGIPSEALPFIFEKFQQADGSRTRAYGGVGLGLHIVKKFTELLGATIEVASEQYKGSTFTVILPVSFKKDSQKIPGSSPAADSNRFVPPVST
ncbi:MAG: sensor histidine kinase [Alphaproteobacteria bacterium]